MRYSAVLHISACSADVSSAGSRCSRSARTLQNLLKTALMPVGIALYVYGGGWNRQDTGSGNTAMHIGLPQSWIDFS